MLRAACSHNSLIFIQLSVRWHTLLFIVSIRLPRMSIVHDVILSLFFSHQPHWKLKTFSHPHSAVLNALGSTLHPSPNSSPTHWYPPPSSSVEEALFSEKPLTYSFTVKNIFIPACEVIRIETLIAFGACLCSANLKIRCRANVVGLGFTG